MGNETGHLSEIRLTATVRVCPSSSAFSVTNKNNRRQLKLISTPGKKKKKAALASHLFRFWPEQKTSVKPCFDSKGKLVHLTA